MDSATILEPLSREELYSIHQFLSLESGSHPEIHRNSAKSELLSRLGEVLSSDDARYCVEFFDNYDYYPVPWLKSELLDSLSDELLQVLVSSFLDDPDIPEEHASLVERLTQSRYFLKEDARKFYLWHHYFQNRVSLEESEEKFANSRTGGSEHDVGSATVAFESPFAQTASSTASAAFEDSHTVQYDAFQLESYLVDANAYREKAFSTSAEQTTEPTHHSGFRSSDNLFSSSSLRPASQKETQAMFAFQDSEANSTPAGMQADPGLDNGASSYATQQISFESFMEFVEARKTEPPAQEPSPETTVQTKAPRPPRLAPEVESVPFEQILDETVSTRESLNAVQDNHHAGPSSLTMALDAASLLELLEEDHEDEVLKESNRATAVKESPAPPQVKAAPLAQEIAQPPHPVVEPAINIAPPPPPQASVSSTGEYELDEASILDDSLDLDEAMLNEAILLEDELLELEEESSPTGAVSEPEPATTQPPVSNVAEAAEGGVENISSSQSALPQVSSEELQKALAQRPIGSLMTPPQIDRVTELLHRASILGGSYERPQIQAIRLYFQKVLDCWPVQLRRVRDVLKYLQSKEIPLVPMKLNGFEEIAQLLPYAARLSLIHTVLFLIGCKSLSNLERHRDFIIDIAATFHVHPGDVSMFTLFGIGPEEIQLTAFECLEVLGVGLEADEDEIRKAHRDKARRYHPDKFHALGPEFRRLADRKMKEVNMALEILVHRSGRTL